MSLKDLQKKHKKQEHTPTNNMKRVVSERKQTMPPHIQRAWNNLARSIPKVFSKRKWPTMNDHFLNFKDWLEKKYKL